MKGIIKKYLIGSILILGSIQTNAQLSLKDVFQRNLDNETIRLVDWEGYMANPAIALTITPPAGAVFPLTVTITANHPRLYFDMPASVGNTGPSKQVIFNNSTPLTFYVSIFPDRDATNETHTLTLNSNYGTQNFGINVIDQDVANPTIDFSIVLDYSADIVYNFYSNQIYKNIVRQAADDWAYFIPNMNFNQVPVNGEFTYIWNDNFTSGYWKQNSTAYSGFLLYPVGLHNTIHRSGGGASNHAFQQIGSTTTNLRRSGEFDTEIHGNYNTLGWNTTITDDTWYLGTNLGDVPNDFYSIALHEMGHSLGFHQDYPVFQTAKNSGNFATTELLNYQQTTVPVDGFSHLSNGQSNDLLKFTDRLSKVGAFGSEYANVMPRGRWLITKLNLLVLKAVGYNLKNTSCFIPPSIATTSLPNGNSGQNYMATLSSIGGIPFYKYEILSENLPTGLSINSFTGEITGVPTLAGSYNFTVKLTDYDNIQVTKNLSITINQANDCLENKTLVSPTNNILNGETTTYKGLSITANNKVMNGANGTYKATKYILLTDGFTAENGSTFKTDLTGCN